MHPEITHGKMPSFLSKLVKIDKKKVPSDDTSTSAASVIAPSETPSFSTPDSTELKDQAQSLEHETQSPNTQVVDQRTATLSTLETATSEETANNASTVQSRSVWDRAFLDLKNERSSLIDDYEKLLAAEIPYLSESSVDETERTLIEHGPGQMEQVTKLGLKRLDEKTMKYTIAGNEYIVKKQVSQVIQATLKLKSMIADAVSSSPPAALAVAGISVILPLFTNPSTMDDANKTGLLYVMSRMRFYVGIEEHLWPQRLTLSNEIQKELEDNLINLYKAILVFQIETALRFYRNWAATFSRDIIKWDDWKAMEDNVKAAEQIVTDYFDQLVKLDARNILEDLRKQAESNKYILEEQVSLLQEQINILADHGGKLNEIHGALEQQTQQQVKRVADKKDV